MAFHNELDTLRSFAKRLARKHQIQHQNALDIIAVQYGHPHWNALIKAWDKGWRPESWELTDINECEVTGSSIGAVGSVKKSEGFVTGEPYTLEVGFDEVLVRGNGWAIYLDHAPSKPATIEEYKKPNALDDKAFFSQIMKIVMKAADEVREAIAKDWGLAPTVRHLKEGKPTRGETPAPQRNVALPSFTARISSFGISAPFSRNLNM